MLKLEVNMENMREGPEASFALAEEAKYQALVQDKQESNLHLPWISTETEKKGGPSSTPAPSTSASVETHSKETKHAYIGPCPFSNHTEQLASLIRSSTWNKVLESGITRIGRPLRECLRNCFHQKRTGHGAHQT